MQAAIKDGSFKKTHVDSMGFVPQDPSQIETKASQKEHFSKFTAKKQPRPGPGSYSIPSTFKHETKPRHHQFFGSTNARFQGSVYHKGIGTGDPELGPGKYELREAIELNENTKR